MAGSGDLWSANVSFTAPTAAVLGLRVDRGDDPQALLVEPGLAEAGLVELVQHLVLDVPGPGLLHVVGVPEVFLRIAGYFALATSDEVSLPIVTMPSSTNFQRALAASGCVCGS